MRDRIVLWDSVDVVTSSAEHGSLVFVIIIIYLMAE
jgi:uncharacterized membrane protein